MHSFVIKGGKPLGGTIAASGNKNSILPLLTATLLTDEPVTLDNVPRIRDVRVLLTLLSELGASVENVTWEK